MSVTVTESQKNAIEAVGYGISGSIGGVPRQTYWTPDGRMVRLVPNQRQFVRKDKDGKVIETGIRDANLDKGLLTSRPQVLKIYCPTCDRWHDDKAGVMACKRAQDRMIAASLRKAKPEMKSEKEETLEKQVQDLTALVKELIGGKGNRKVFQRKTDEPEGAVGPARAAKEGVQ